MTWREWGKLGARSAADARAHVWGLFVVLAAAAWPAASGGTTAGSGACLHGRMTDPVTSPRPATRTRTVLPNGAVTGLDIGFSNASLVHITMSFYTMCKSTTPIFLLAFAFVWGLET
jgi:hypothetical protein